MKIVVPWVNEFATTPRKISQLMEKRALEDWYERHSKQKRPQVSDPAYNFVHAEKRRMRRFIGQLSDTEQVIVYLRYWENLLATEISALLGLPERKIEEILRDSVGKLRSLYINELNRVQALSGACA